MTSHVLIKNENADGGFRWARHTKFSGIDKKAPRYILDSADVSGEDCSQRVLPRPQGERDRQVRRMPHPKAGIGGMGKDGGVVYTATLGETSFLFPQSGIETH